MAKHKSLIFIAIVISLFAICLKNNRQETVQIPNTKTVRDFKSNLAINDGVNTFIFDSEEFVGKSALEATQKLTNNKVIISGVGKDSFISSINDKTINPDKREFWELFINGISSKVSAEKYIIQKGDQIEWHINLHS